MPSAPSPMPLGESAEPTTRSRWPLLCASAITASNSSWVSGCLNMDVFTSWVADQFAQTQRCSHTDSGLPRRQPPLWLLRAQQAPDGHAADVSAAAPPPWNTRRAVLFPAAAGVARPCNGREDPGRLVQGGADHATQRSAAPAQQGSAGASCLRAQAAVTANECVCNCAPLRGVLAASYAAAMSARRSASSAADPPQQRQAASWRSRRQASVP
eukprot:scaffold3886_cov399-Prasinococcus_capsulatus_cf.AAC.31